MQKQPKSVSEMERELVETEPIEIHIDPQPGRQIKPVEDQEMQKESVSIPLSKHDTEIPSDLGILTIKYMKVTALDGDNISIELVDEEKPKIVRKAEYVRGT